MLTYRKVITVFVLATVAFMISGSAASANSATIQQLPTCTDPTGQNLPCMMVISTLPPPANTLQCQETSGQILPCSYTTQNLNNGNQIVAITVYAPANFVFNSPTVIKVIVHDTTTTKFIREDNDGKKVCPPLTICSPVPPPSSCKGIEGVHGCIIFLPGGKGYTPTPIYLTPLPPGPHTLGFKSGWFDGNTGSDPYNPYPIGSKDWLAYNLGYKQGGAKSTPYTNCDHYDKCPDPKYDPTNDPKYKPQTYPSPCAQGGVVNCSSPLTNPTPPVPLTSTSLTPSCAPPSSCVSPSAGGVGDQQHHTAEYLQALNSGSPNPYKPGTKNYEHYQAGLDAKQQSSGGSSSGGGSSSVGSSSGGGSSSVGSSSGGGSGGSSNGGSGSGSGSGGGSGPPQPTTTS